MLWWFYGLSCGFPAATVQHPERGASSGSWNSAGNDLEHGRSKTGWRSNLNRQSIHLIQLQSSYFLWQELRGEQFLVWCCPEGAALLRSRSSWLATWLQFHHTKLIQIPLVGHQIYIQEYINVSWRGKARKPKSMTFNKYVRLFCSFPCQLWHKNRLLGLGSMRQGPGHGTRCAARLEVVKEMHILEDEVGPDGWFAWGFAGLLRIPNQLPSMEP